MKTTLNYLMVPLVFMAFMRCKSEPPRENNSMSETPSALKVNQKTSTQNFINPAGTTIKDRFSLPKGFIRVESSNNSFQAYLQSLPLKPHGSKVKYFNGEIKPNRNVYLGVIDIDVGKRDLQQCADAVMRLRGEFLWQQKHFDQIHFNFTNGFRVDYSKWMQGKRIKVSGSKVNWYNAKTPSNTYKDFRAYMNIIFAYAGTLSLAKELESVSMEEMQIGDVLIQGGSPGHAVIVVDMARHQETKEKVFLLAQSYMPAQDIQILQNPEKEKENPWYSNKTEGTITTPEWTFYSNDLKRFKQ